MSFAALLLAASLVECVDPMIGTVTYPESGLRGDETIHGFGKTFPGAASPFGMVQLSPDTITGGDNGSGYSYTHKTIEGFSMTHMSGVGWFGEFGNFQVMPTTGPRILDREKAASPFSHSNEVARAGYYSVFLDRYGIKVELETIPETNEGCFRFTYPESDCSRIQIDLARRVGEKERAKRFSTQTVRLLDDRTICGEIRCDHRDGGWGQGAGGVDYTIYYVAKFQKKLEKYGIEGAPSNTVFWTEFPTKAGERTWMTCFISFESLAHAMFYSGMRLSPPTKDYPWGDALSSIDVKGGTKDERTIFATALYHSMLDPRAVGKGKGFTRRTVFSGWDVYRSEMPLLALIRPDVVSDTVNSMMETVTSGKRKTLPRWDIFGCPSGCMIGAPIVPVMACAYEAGIRSFDAKLAVRLASETLDAEGNNRKLGYKPGSLSDTLEYAYADWCCARLADMVGERDVAARHYAYAQAYTNCWSKEVGWMRARTADGGWLKWQGREKSGQGCVEANPWQQGWFVPHDPDGFIRLVGGRAKFTEELERFFSVVPDDFRWNDAYNHPNEPCHTLPFLWALSDRPKEVGHWTRRICRAAYGTGPFGLCGNDDVGQMSAWYVLAALGIHPLCPGDGKWYLTAPIFPEATIKMPARGEYAANELRIVAHGAEDPSKERVASAKLDGKPLDRPYVLTSELLTSKTLELVLE